MKPIFRLILFLTALILSNSVHSQVTVGLDNWYNREARNGKPFHYLWNDTTESGYSRWGTIFQQKGAKLTTIEKPTEEALRKVQVYILVDPDTTKENPSPNYISSKDIKVITKWVKNGGVLMILANDAPNCEFTHLNMLSAHFGIQFNHITLKPVKGTEWEMGAFKNLGNHQIFRDVTKIYMKEVSSLSLKNKATPVLTENNIVFMAESRYGKGMVFAVGDPWIYNEYIDHDRLSKDFDNRKAAENLTDYLLKNAQN